MAGAAVRAGATPVFATMLRPPAEVVGSRQTYYQSRLGSAHLAASWLNMLLHTERATRESVADGGRVFVRYADLLDDWTAGRDRAPASSSTSSTCCTPRSEAIREGDRLRRPGPAPDDPDPRRPGAAAAAARADRADVGRSSTGWPSPAATPPTVHRGPRPAPRGATSSSTRRPRRSRGRRSWPPSTGSAGSGRRRGGGAGAAAGGREGRPGPARPARRGPGPVRRGLRKAARPAALTLEGSSGCGPGHVRVALSRSGPGRTLDLAGEGQPRQITTRRAHRPVPTPALNRRRGEGWSEGLERKVRHT